MKSSPRSHARSYVAALAFMLLLGGCAQAPATESSTSASAALEASQQRFVEAMSAQDLDALMALFAADATVQVANMPAFEGREAIRGLYGNVFRFLESSEYAPQRLEMAASADLAYSSGRVTTAFAGERGRMTFPGKYVLVWTRREGDWAVVLYAVSNDRAEAPGR